jgi:hypothetical protein
MSLDGVRGRLAAGGLWGVAALVVWVLLCLLTCARSAAQPDRNSLYPVWQEAGHDWLTAHDLYETRVPCLRAEFRYSPLFAAGFVVCEVLPPWLGNVLLRAINAAALVVAFGWWLRSASPFPTAARQRAVAWLLLAPLALGSLNNGQMNLVMTALILAALAAVAHQRWWLAALAAALAVLLKIYPVTLFLLVVLVEPRRFGLRFLAALLAVALVPFLLQHPDYVARQYALWWDKVKDNDEARRFISTDAGYRDAWMLVRLWRLPVTLRAYTLLQAAVGLSCALLTLFTWWRVDRGRLLLFVILASGTSWLLLFGPAPESCTYVVAAPAFVAWLLNARREGREASYACGAFGYGLLLLCVVATAVSRGKQLYPDAGLQPLGMLLLAGPFAATAWGWVWRGRSATAPAGQDTSRLAA